MKKQILNFRLEDDTVLFLRDMATRTKRPMTFFVELALLDLKIKDISALKKELEMGERDTCYHGVPQDSKHFCNKCQRLGYLTQFKHKLKVKEEK